MNTGIRPMEVQPNFPRDDLRQYQIPARGGQSSGSKIIVVQSVVRPAEPSPGKAPEATDN